MEFRPSSPEIAALFDRCLPADPAVVRRKMFGWPAAFVNGNMFASTHLESIVVRLPEDARRELLEGGGRPFEPMPGREMRGYVVVPGAMLGEDELRAWLARALDFAAGLPKKR